MFVKDGDPESLRHPLLLLQSLRSFLALVRSLCPQESLDQLLPLSLQRLLQQKAEFLHLRPGSFLLYLKALELHPRFLQCLLQLKPGSFLLYLKALELYPRFLQSLLQLRPGPFRLCLKADQLLRRSLQDRLQLRPSFLGARAALCRSLPASQRRLVSCRLRPAPRPRFLIPRARCRPPSCLHLQFLAHRFLGPPFLLPLSPSRVPQLPLPGPQAAAL